MTSFVLSLGQVDSIHSFVNDTVNNNDDWSSLIIQCVDSCADNEQATAVVEEMLNQLDVEAEADLGPHCGVRDGCPGSQACLLVPIIIHCHARIAYPNILWHNQIPESLPQSCGL